jgi:5-methylcytosine-specific restriction endonuclease McrA
MARKNRDWDNDEDEAAVPILLCWLCTRPMGKTVVWHHPIPKSRGGKERQPIHQICLNTVHANFTNSDLEKRYSTAEALLGNEEIKRFVDWVANKPPDFHAPTKKMKS